MYPICSQVVLSRTNILSVVWLLSGIIQVLISILGSIECNPTPVIDGDGPTVGQKNVDHQQQQADDELSLLFLIHRHGDRAPISLAPNDPYQFLLNDIWPTGLGMLTNAGKERMFKLGKFLRKRYSSYLGVSDPRQVYTQSSDVDRCIASAQLVLAGLYPPVGGSVWNKDLAWQPVAVHTRPQQVDPMLNVESDCPIRQREYDRVFTLEDNKKSLSQMDGAQLLREKLSSEYGFTFDTVFDWYDASSTFNIEKENNLTLPEWLLSNMDRLDRIAYASELFWTNTDLQKRLYAGVVIDDITKRMLEYRKRNNNNQMNDERQQQQQQQDHQNWDKKKNYKLFHYSTHDTNIHAIMNTLGVYQGQVFRVPGFGSTILIELHRSNRSDNTDNKTATQGADYSVKLFFLGESKEEHVGIKELKLTNCLRNGQDDKCSLDMFTNYTEQYRLTPEDWFQECVMQPNNGQIDTV